MDKRTARIIITVTMATYFLVISSCNGHVDMDIRLPDSVYNYGGITRRTYDRDLMQFLYRSYERVRRGHQHMSDAGYGSRVQAGSKVANALIAHHVYGAYGPGRRKRDTLPSTMSATKRFNTH